MLSGSFLRRSITLLCAAFACLALPACSRDTPPPSLILVLVDTLRADYLGAYGFRGPISPNLDRLAAESVVFERAYSQAPWTKPAIATLFTGLEVPVHRVTTQRGEFGEPGRRRRPMQEKVETDILPDAAETLAESLAAAGYDTAAFVANPWVRRSYGFAQGFAEFDDRHVANDTPAERILDAARAWLGARDGARPFFLYLHFMDVHDPYDAPEEDVAALRDSESLGADRTLERRELPAGMMTGMRSRRIEWIDSDAALSLREWRARYAAGVRAFDRRFAGFVEELRASGQLDRTAIVFTSDHGEELFEHGGWAHGKNLHEHQLRIPLIVRLPGGADGGRRVADLAALTDVMPTMLGLARVAVPQAVQGRDLLAAPAPDAAPREAVFAAGVKWKPRQFAVQTVDRKLIKDFGSGRATLYDSVGDPWEQKDIAAGNGVEAFRLGELLDRHLVEAGRHPGVGRASAEIDPQVQERLRSLGYLE